MVEGSEVEVTEESDLKTISEKLRLVSFQDGAKGKEVAVVESKTSGMSDEELARMLQVWAFITTSVRNNQNYLPFLKGTNLIIFVF